MNTPGLKSPNASFPRARSFLEKVFGSRALFALFTPSIGPVAGLEISDLHLRYFGVDKKQVVSQSLRLPPGVIVGGSIKDQAKLESALVYLKSVIGAVKNKKINVVAVIPSEITYLQVFKLPYLRGQALEDAAKLNLEMISPIPFAQAQTGWEILRESGGELELLGAFSAKENIESLGRALKNAGFMVVAIEPAASALSRAIKKNLSELSGEPYIIVHVSDSGLDFICVRDSRAYFNYFVSWHSLYGDSREISAEVFREAIVQNVRKIINFSFSHSGVEVKRAVVLSAAMEDKFKEILSQNFKLEIVPLVSQAGGKINPEFISVTGAYLRGLVPLSEDIAINLSRLSTKQEFFDLQIISFIRIWRNIAVAFLIFMALVFWGTDIFVQKIYSNIKSDKVIALGASEIKSFKELRDSASEFNSLVSLVGAVKAGRQPVYPYLAKILEVSGSGVNIDRIIFSSLASPVKIYGEAASEDILVNFKKALENQKEFSSVDLPLKALNQDPSGKVSFSLTIVFKLPNS